jgi:hypothetical protein
MADHPTQEQMDAIHQFRNQCLNYHIDDWKQHLLDAWRTGGDVNAIPDGHLLRQVRNQFGPSWLATIPF